MLVPGQSPLKSGPSAFLLVLEITFLRSMSLFSDRRDGSSRNVASSFKILLFGVILRQTIQLALKYLNRMNPKLNYVNPMDFLLYPQGGLPGGSGTEKSWADFTFVAYHVIFWSLCVYPLFTSTRVRCILRSASGGSA